MWDVRIEAVDAIFGTKRECFCGMRRSVDQVDGSEMGGSGSGGSGCDGKCILVSRCRWSWNCCPVGGDVLEQGGDEEDEEEGSSLVRTRSLPRERRAKALIFHIGNRNECGVCNVRRSYLHLNENAQERSIRIGVSGKRIRTCNLRETEDRVQRALCQRPQVDAGELKRRLDLMQLWFSEFDDAQKNIALKTFLGKCGGPQNHLLSVALQDRLHQWCPVNCQDLLSWLPTNLALQIFSFLDPVSLCQCLRVCRSWNSLASEPRLWQRFCRMSKWQLSPAGERKQYDSLKLQQRKSVDWKKAFSERFRLRRNWTKGYCHVRTFEGHSQGVTCVQFDETRIVSGSSDKTVKVWNIRTNSQWTVMTLVGHSGTVRCLHLEGNRLVSGATDCTIKVWDLSSQLGWSSIACKVTMVGHMDTVRCLQVRDDRLVSGSYDRTLKVWDIHTGLCRLTLSGHEAAVLCVQFDLQKIISGSCDKTIKIWELNGRCTATLLGHKDAVTCLQFDERRIISGSLDRTIKFWDMSTGNCLSTLDWMKSEGHTGVIRCLQADRWRIVSGGDDKTLKVWSLETGQRLVTLKNHTDGVTCLQFNDSVIASGSYDKTVRLWDFSVC